MTTIIKGGTVVSTTGADRAEVLVDGEIIVALLLPGSDTAEAAERGAEQVIDATGKYVIPGGVDVHTHMELPFAGTNASDDSRLALVLLHGAAPRPSSTLRHSRPARTFAPVLMTAWRSPKVTVRSTMAST